MENYLIVLVLYILPMFIVLRVLYRNDEITTIRDLLNSWWLYFIPGVNILVLLFYYGGTFFGEGRGYKVVRFWNKIMDKKLK